MSFSIGQQGLFRPLVNKAWLAECTRLGEAPNNKNAKDRWYRAQLMDAASVSSTRECNRTSDFEMVMLPFAIIAGDDYWIGRCTAGAERRLKYIIRENLKDLTWLLKEKHDWKYVLAVYKQSKMLPAKMDDAPAWQLYKVMQMLDKQIQRICKDYGIRRRDVPRLRKRGADIEVEISPESKRLHVGHDLDRIHTKPRQTELPF